MNQINWTKRAVKQLLKLERKTQVSVSSAVMSLVDFSESSNVIALKNHQYDYRLRVGNYRVMFNYDGEVKVVNIEEVKKRDGRTY